MYRFSALLLVFLACTGVFAERNEPAIGTNLNGLSYWSTELPFHDSFKTSGAWVSCARDTWNDGRKLDLDERGWVRSLRPDQIASCVLFSDTRKFRGSLARRFVVQYEGNGRLEYAELAGLVERREHCDVIELKTGSGNAVITLVETDPGNYLRNIRITPEGSKVKPEEIFNPVFLERLKGYRVLRFTAWILGESIEDIAPRSWNKRPTLQDARWTVKGAPVEIMVALANRVQADPWFSLPHAADDQYILLFAELVKKRLDPKLKVYLEYSNEVWNDVFPQTAYARKKGLALGLGKDPNEALLRFYARRSVRIFSIWEKVLGKGRLVRVLSFQSDGLPEYSDKIALSFGDTRSHVDAIAIGPYFGTDLAADARGVALTRKMSLDELFRELEVSSLPKARTQMLSHSAVARRYGLPLIAYEGGQHLWNMSGREDRRINDLFNAANRDPRMGALYSRYLSDWNEVGGLFVHLLDCGNFENAGNWGALEYITQPREEAPKFDALHRYIEGR